MRHHLYAGQTKCWKVVKPERPAVGLALYENEVARLPGFFQAFQPIGNNLALTLAPVRSLFRDQGRAQPVARRRCAIGQVIGDLEASRSLLGDTQVEEVLPGQQLVRCEINEVSLLRCVCSGCDSDAEAALGNNSARVMPIASTICSREQPAKQLSKT